MKVWDGTRARTARIVLGRTSVVAAGIEFDFVTERIATPTDWCFQTPDHTIVVHRGGRLRSMEIEFERGPSGRADPRIGDVWVIPAGHRYAALAQGSVVDFCEFSLPTTMFADRGLRPAIENRDPLTYSLTHRIKSLADRTDVFAELLRESLAQTLRLHLSDSLTPAEQVKRRQTTMDSAAQTRIVEYLEDALDSQITIAALANEANMSVHQFLRAFAVAFHTTPHQFLINRRIARAKMLLTTTSRSVADIAVSVGFSTHSHFTTTFKRKVGVTPHQYRASALR